MLPFQQLTNKELAEDEHLRSRPFFAELEHPEVGVRQHAGIPWHFSDTPCQVRRPAPCFGRDTEDVLQRVLGYATDEVATLKDNGVLT